MTRPPHRSEPVRRGRPAIAPPPRAGRAVAGVVARFAKEFGGASFADIAARWSEIVGEKTARMCAPVKLTGRGEHGVLHIAVAGPAALLVEADAPRILAAVNRYCGRDVARRVTIARAPARGPLGARPPAGAAPQGLAPTARLKLEAEVADIKDPQLKAALMKLGRATHGESARPPRSMKGS
jgi:hypothetical protein